MAAVLFSVLGWRQLCWDPGQLLLFLAAYTPALFWIPHPPTHPPNTRLQAALGRWVSGTSRVPLLGWLSGRAAEILVGVQRYYTYIERMAAS